MSIAWATGVLRLLLLLVALAATADAQERFAFPLEGFTPYTAPVASVFDHSGLRYQSNGVVIAYTGECGTIMDPLEPPAQVILYSYKKSDGNLFICNGNYLGTATTGPATLNYDGHPGWDYAVGIGSNVYAVANGRVITATNTPTSGNYVQVQHGENYLSQYLHLDTILVSSNDTVTCGQLIGKSGNTGGVAAHLHFEVKKLVSGSWISVDPYGWFGEGVDPYYDAYGISNVNVWADASPLQGKCTMTVICSPPEGGMARGGGQFAVGSSAILAAWPNDGYSFIDWNEPGKNFVVRNPYSCIVSNNRTLTAKFVTNRLCYTYTSDGGGITIRDGTGSSGSVVLPDRVDGLPVVAINSGDMSTADNGFFLCTNLTRVTIPSSVKTIGWGAFCSLPNLTSVNIPDSVTNIAAWAFYWCINLDVTIPTSVKSIGAQAFEGTGVSHIVIPDGISSIEWGTFWSCSKLQDIAIPNSVTNIDDYAFAGCYNLASISIPGRIARIGAHAFEQCRALDGVIVPSSVRAIEDLAFSACPNLFGVYFRGNAPAIGCDIFLWSTNVTVHYLAGTTGWGPTFGGRPTVLWNGAPPVPESWKASYFGAGWQSDPRANDDVDVSGTGMPNWKKFLAGLNPLDRNDRFEPAQHRFDKGTSNAVYTLQWKSKVGKVYQVQYSGDLRAWNAAGTNVTATSTLSAWTDDGSQTGSPPNQQTKRFYRVKVVP